MTIYEVGIAVVRNINHLFHRSSDASTPDFDDVYTRLALHHHAAKLRLHQTHRHAKKLFRRHKLTLHNVRHAATKATAGAALAGSLFVSPVHSGAPKQTDTVKTTTAQIPPAPSESIKVAGPTDPSPTKMTRDQVTEKIKDIMQNSSRDGNLSTAQFTEIKQLLHDQFGIDVDTKTDSGFALNKNFGMDGREQHIPTKPGDNAANHVNQDDPNAVASGLTRGRGAWGYAPANEERWYVVGQTFLSEQFGTDASKSLAGQRYIVIQVPEDSNGNHLMIGRGALWDAGPGRSTGKVFGASPEFFSHVGDASYGAAKFKAIMLPESGSPKPASDLGIIDGNLQ